MSMNLQHYILNDFDPLEITSSIREARDLARQFTHTHIPVAQNGVFIGCMSETDASCFDGDSSLDDFNYAIEPIHVLQDDNWVDVLEKFAIHDSNIMPVLDRNQQYLGYYELNDIIDIFTHTPFLSEPGGIIVVEKEIQEYSFSEIAQIVESNDARLYGMFISAMKDNTVEITVKIGQNNINQVVQTFRRYNYTIMSQHDEDKMMEDLKARSKYLDKYLNI